MGADQQPARGRPPRPAEEILDGALALIDEHGAAHVSMRALAEQLGSGTATLYRHFADRDELLAQVVDRVVGEALRAAAQGAGGGGWRSACETYALALYETLARHPGALALLAAQVPTGPNALAARERAIASLTAGGLQTSLAARAYTTLAGYVIGVALAQHAEGGTRPRRRARLRALYGALDPDAYPATVAAAEALADTDPRAEFRFGLGLLLDGLERELGRVGPDRARAGAATGTRRARGGK